MRNNTGKLKHLGLVFSLISSSVLVSAGCSGRAKIITTPVHGTAQNPDLKNQLDKKDAKNPEYATPNSGYEQSGLELIKYQEEIERLKTSESLAQRNLLTSKRHLYETQKETETLKLKLQKTEDELTNSDYINPTEYQALERTNSRLEEDLANSRKNEAFLNKSYLESRRKGFKLGEKIIRLEMDLEGKQKEYNDLYDWVSKHAQEHHVK